MANKTIRKVNSTSNTEKVLISFSNNTQSKRKIYSLIRKRLKYFLWNKRIFKLVSYNTMTQEYVIQEIGYVEPGTKKLKISYQNENGELEEMDLEDENEEVEDELPELSIEEEGYVDYIRNPRHSKEQVIIACIKHDIPVYLAGPAGSGKNFILQKVSEGLGLKFYFTNSVQQEYKVTGFIDAGGVFHETEFYKAFKNGGLFFLDEIDASIPEVLILLNAAIANRYFEFPNGRIDAHEDFRVVAAGNTIGSGADELYVGRLVLDQATLDRFAIIEFDYERPIELSIAKGNAHLVDFIRELRRISNQNGIRATFSYRSIMMVRDLERARVDLKEILKIAVFKGMRQDNINTFSLWDDNTKYGRALRELQI